jgi:hypothetical protein
MWNDRKGKGRIGGRISVSDTGFGIEFDLVPF